MLLYFSKIILLSAIFLTCYTYLFYPIILFVVTSGKTCDKKGDGDDCYVPSVSIVVAAYNEEKIIESKLKNISALDYPKDRITSLIASDGSDDATCEIVRGYGASNITLVELPRSGKVNVLNSAVPLAHGEIIVFSDANTMYRPDAIKKLVTHFKDPGIGCVCGNLTLVNPKKLQSGEGESFYWRYESWIKEKESRLGCVVGANGAIYAIRKSLFEKMPAKVINDDFHISMKIMERGHKVIYEKEAIGTEDVALDFNSEFLRHVRDGAGHYQEIAYLTGLLNPFKGIRFFAYVSHRFIRWIVPFLLPIIIIFNIPLLQSYPYRILFILQISMYTLAILTFFLQRADIETGIFKIPFFFLSINCALIIGFFKNISGAQGVTWDRTAR
ncbi:MAG: glycosyltransferase family 2 protein [bacterium]